MAKIKIETYRNWDISFDNEMETFYALSDKYDKDMEKKSYSAVKKAIDDFIKANLKFIPTRIHMIRYGELKELTLIGLRKDGRFVYLDEKKQQQQLSEYDERECHHYSKKNEEIQAQVKILEKDVQKINQEISKLKDGFTKGAISDIREKYKDLYK
jgi:hypothetical protein